MAWKWLAALSVLTMLLASSATPQAPEPREQAAPREWQDEIVYVIVLQKFFDGDPGNNVMARKFAADRAKYEGGFWGGDLEGVRLKLDELAKLGVTTLLLYPVVANDRQPIRQFLPTGYRPRDYFQVDENFGDMAALRRLIDEAHTRGLKVLLDLPLGMPGFEHPYAIDKTKAAWFGKPTMYGPRQWNTEHDEAADYLIEVARFWQEKSGCDGFRLDSAQMHPVKFWQRFVRELKAHRPGGDFRLVAELPLHPQEIGKFTDEAGFDGAYDFSAGAVVGVLGKGESAFKLSFVMGEAKKYYPRPRVLMAQLDQYEDPEFVEVAKPPVTARMETALTYLLTIDRVPLIYSGDELALAYDDVGRAFPADRDESPVFKHLQKLIALRRAEPVLRHGDCAVVHADEKVLAYLRTFEQDRVLVVLNASDEAQDARLELPGVKWKSCELRDLLADAVAKKAGENQPLKVPPLGVAVLRVTAE